MKKFLTLSLLTLLTFSVYAKQMPTTKITNVAIKENDKNITISFNAIVTDLNSNYKLTLNPILYYGSQSKPLSPIVILGRNKSIMEKRSKQQIDKEIVGKQKQNIPYEITIPYESWMNEVSLKVNSRIEGCGNTQPLASSNLVTNKLIHYDIEPRFNTANIEPKLSELQKFDQTASFLYPATDYNSRHEMSEQERDNGALIVHFEQSNYLIDPSYMTNRHAIAQINKVFDLISADPNASLKKIVIVGRSSPEGRLDRNDILADKRANTLKNFVSERVKYNPNMFELINGSEDWSGLKKLVENSNMLHRQQVLEIIEKYPIRSGREVELMKLKAGNPYRYMMEHFFPLLRNAGYVQVYYESIQDTDAEVVNNAIKLLNNKQYSEALTLLLSVKSDKQLENMMGVCYMMTENYALATIYFEKAIANGNSDASYATSNLEQIRIIQSLK